MGADLHEAFREFRAAWPALLRYWLVVAAAMFPIGLIAYRGEIGEAAALAIGIVPLGIALIGGLWLRLSLGKVRPSRARIIVGLGWLLLTLLPAAGATAILLTVLRRLFGVRP